MFIQPVLLAFSTGGDGTFSLQLRQIEASEPVLSPKEYKLIGPSTKPLVLNFPSGVIAVGDYGALDSQFAHRQTVKPGAYKVAAFIFNTRRNFFAYYIVFCQTDLPATNHLSHISRLEP
jgi:hypothetical protein